MAEIPDSYLRSILTSVKTIALVGASANPVRPSHEVMQFLLAQGYDVYPVNPGLAGQELLGRKVYASLADIPAEIDMVDVFRQPDALPQLVDEALALGIDVLWTQLGVVHEAAAQVAANAGMHVVMDRCPAIEIPRLNLVHAKH